MDSKVDRRIAGLLAIVATVLACGASAVSFPAHLSFQPSLHAGTSDADGKPIVGTEIMHLVPHQGRLYAGNSLWMESDRQVPKACQILVLDSPHGPWKVDHQFTKRNLRLAALRSFTLTTDGSGKAIRPVPMLLAAPDVTVHGTVQIVSRDDTTGTWAPMNFAEASKYSTTPPWGCTATRPRESTGSSPATISWESLAESMILVLLSLSVARGLDWPEFRGPSGNGHAAAAEDAKPAGLPLHWRPVSWRRPLLRGRPCSSAHQRRISTGSIVYSPANGRSAKIGTNGREVLCVLLGIKRGEPIQAGPEYSARAFVL